MSLQRRNLEKKWIRNFQESPLIDKDTGVLITKYAHQLFYGKLKDEYPDNYPDNFFRFYKSHKKSNKSITNYLVQYLDFIGIEIRKKAINSHLEEFPDDLIKLLKKCYNIFKMLAHSNSNFNTLNPYYDNKGDILFLLRIECEEGVPWIKQLNLFEDLELPDLYSKCSKLPNNYENTEVVQTLFKKIEYSNNSFYITGKAGTGKSTFIYYFAKETKKKILMIAFTGIAAINIGGQTIHSFFKFPFKPLMPKDSEITIFSKSSQQFKIIKAIDTIIIDEVSMLRSDILEAMDFSLRKNGGDPTQKFGGKQLLLVGDIFQLPPVTDSKNEAEKILFSEIYKSKYFFDSPTYKELSFTYFEFTKSYRQKDDLYFIELLDKVRICQVDDQTLSKINERYNPSYTPKINEFVITLSATNLVADTENSKKILNLPYTGFTFKAIVKGEFKKDKYPTSELLYLKKNAQIIFIKNDGARNWVNGTIAKVDFISDDLIEVRLQNGTIYKLEPATWENRKYSYNREQEKIVSEVIGTFTQFPIKLAWAITIHKSQGLTFDNVVIDMGTGAFVNGQVYTALSRCKTLKGIVLKKMLRKNDIITNNQIINFHRSKQTTFGINR